MIIRANVGGAKGDFLLDSRGKVAVTEAKYSVIGKSILNKGVVSFDIARSKYYAQPFNQGEESAAPVVKKEAMAFVPGKVNSIDRAYFLENNLEYINAQFLGKLEERGQP
jgi:hypothetical protein